jgi:hypothetical protein
MKEGCFDVNGYFLEKFLKDDIFPFWTHYCSGFLIIISGEFCTTYKSSVHGRWGSILVFFGSNLANRTSILTYSCPILANRTSILTYSCPILAFPHSILRTSHFLTLNFLKIEKSPNLELLLLLTGFVLAVFFVHRSNAADELWSCFCKRDIGLANFFLRDS